MRKIVVFLLLSFLLLLSACSPSFFIQKVGTKFLESGIQAIYSESDPEIARTTLEYNISLLRTFSTNNPDNQFYHLLLAQALGFYAFAFIEDSSPLRAKELYQRGMEHALGVFSPERRPDLQLPLKDFENRLLKYEQSDVPQLFWLCYNWGGYLQLSLDDPSEILNLSRLEAMMRRVSDLDDTYNFGGIHLLLGSYYAARPVMFGGKPEAARHQFEKCRTISGEEFLLVDLMEARYLAVQTGDRDMFLEKVDKIMNFPNRMIAEYSLFNSVAKEKARILKEKESSLFMD